MTTAIKIGWAHRDITPDRPVLLRGLFNLRVATRVNDRLTCTALALQTADEQAIIVSADVVAIDEAVLASCRKQVAGRLPGFEGSKLIISATHTHTGPYIGGKGGLQDEADYLAELQARFPDYLTVADCTQLFVERVTEAACEAWEHRAAGKIGWGYSYAVVGENRRVRYFDDRSVMYGKTDTPDFSHIEGHVDHGVNLVFTYGPDECLTGVLVNVACPSQSNEGGQDYISADYWSNVREEVRRRHGEGLFVLPQCSAAGDITPHRLIAREAEDRMLRLKYGEGLSRASNLPLRKDIARRIADAVDDAEPAVRRDLREGVEFRHEVLRLNLPHWDVTEPEYADVKAEIAACERQLDDTAGGDALGPPITRLRSRIQWCRRVIDRYRYPPVNVPVQSNVMRLGNVAFVTCPFEYYLDFGDRIKGRSKAVQTFVVQLAGRGTYLPTDRAASGRSYGAVPASCRVSPEGGQTVVDEAVRAIDAMFA